MSVEDLEKKEDPPAPGRDEPVAEQLLHRLRTRRGRYLYKLRKQTVHPDSQRYLRITLFVGRSCSLPKELTRNMLAMLYPHERYV